ncbi:MAG: hypothetical protein JSV91_08025 [Phycisphaerales bacterium]|nr:MAG: hypothetical protein JSV91_08025 [Phycisphaerales bacterium]
MSKGEPRRSSFSHLPSTAAAALAALIALTATATLTEASERKFTYVYQTTTEAPGEIEYEQWITWKTDKGSDSEYDRFDIRHELEIGLTENLQLGLYLADWRSQRGSSVGDGVEYRGTAVELIYNLTDPTVDFLGSALYGELKLGPELFELEGKILLEKNIGKWTGAYNAGIESEWEGDNFGEDKGELFQSFGLSYQVSPKFTLGAEVLHEIPVPDWSDTGDSVLYLGPNASFRTDDWWVTLTPLFQVTDEDSEADFQLRLIFGFTF